ncbi:MAG: GGDEF domain-containing response regulator [Betaproteobacteria bacterium]|nr:GGDEF domain-containing response regulator [Betaproteobacteria bacterium]
MDTCEPTRILIVDDSEDDGMLISHQLKREIPNVSFRRVDCEQDMRLALQEQGWDLVISDHSMPNFDSVRALEVLREVRRNVPFIVYSGHYDQEKGLAAMTGGADDFVYKSNSQRLLPVVRRELRNSRLHREKEQAERTARTLSLFDELTGLPNRNLLAQQVQSRVSESGPAALVCMDLDRFMRINDSFGYGTGDALLKQVAKRLEAVLGPSDLLARLGSDRFASLLWNVAGGADACAQAERMLGVFSVPFQQNGQELFLTASVGCSLLPEHGSDAGTLLRAAESAMALAKKNGRNRIEVFDPKLSHGASTRLQLESALHHAVEREELFLHYQPMYEVVSQRVGAAEALVRWRHERFGVVPPNQFIPLADDTGYIIEIGEWVLRTACRQARHWQQAGRAPLAVAVNFSAAQFRDEHINERVRNAIEESGLPPELLEVEITETVAMQDAEHTIAKLRGLKRMGVRIAIDDFGTGYSSLSYLRRFPIDVLKIDRSFVMELPDDGDSLSIVRTIVALASALKIGTVAEGVETAEQFKLLADEGVERVQGFYFSKPLSVEDFSEKFITRRSEEKDGEEKIVRALRLDALMPLDGLRLSASA